MFDEQFTNAGNTVVDTHVEPPVDQANAGEQQVVLDRTWDRIDLQTDDIVRLEAQHDPQQQE
ncbi:MAG TPA: hypothetical protein VHQ23_13810, partial [Ilumatobacteraceae bacterium]|nr:hypothetical protein [Ilumatobacteraceae bacterium]